MTSYFLLRYAACFAVSYLLGSLNFGIIVSKLMYHKDIRSFGSGNAGTTNMLRTFGKPAAALTVAGDILKGTFSVLSAKAVFSALPLIADGALPLGLSLADRVKLGVYLAVAGALIGHLKPIYFGFKGGKGVAVAFGAMAAAETVPVMICFGIFVRIVLFTRIVSLASILSVLCYFAVTLGYFKVTGQFSAVQLAGAIIFPILIIYSHRSNVARLLNGTEYKFGRKK